MSIMAPKTKYSPEFDDFICQNLAIGVPYREVAQALGVTTENITDWIRRKKHLPAKIAMLKSEHARARLERTSAEWWLERMYPEFRHKQEIDATLTIVKNMSREEIVERLREKIGSWADSDQDEKG